MVEQWNRDLGTLEDLMVKQWKRRTIMVEQRWENGRTIMVEKWNMEEWNRDGGTVEHLIVEHLMVKQ